MLVRWRAKIKISLEYTPKTSTTKKKENRKKETKSTKKTKNDDQNGTKKNETFIGKVNIYLVVHYYIHNSLSVSIVLYRSHLVVQIMSQCVAKGHSMRMSLRLYCKLFQA